MKFSLLLCALCFTLPAFAGLQRLNLSDAMRMQVVAVEATARGGYTGQALELRLINKSGNPLLIAIDPALIFQPSDTTQQDLVLAGGEKISIPPFKETHTAVITFCAKSYARSPRAGEQFKFLKKGDDILQQLLHYLSQNHLLTSSLAQSAVWVVTNGHSLNTLYSDDMVVAGQKLVTFLSGITGRPMPDYYAIHEQRNLPDQPVYNPKALSIIASFEVKLSAPKILTLGVYDDTGAMIQPVFENKTFGARGHRFKVNFQASDVVAGAYYIRLTEGDTVLQEKKVVVQ